MSFVDALKNFFSRISLLLIFLLALGFMFIRTDIFFPVNTEFWRQKVLETIILFFIFFSIDGIANKSAVQPLIRASFLKEFPKFILSALINFILFFSIAFFVKGNSMSAIGEALSGIPFWAVIVYSFLVAIPEQWIFFRVLPILFRTRLKMKKIWADLFSIIFCWCSYHALTGRSIWVLLFYIPLGLYLVWIRDRFSPDTNMADSGAHFSWDIIAKFFLPT